MSAAEILAYLPTIGINLWVEGERLKYEATSPLKDTMLAQLKTHKIEIINILRHSNTGSELHNRDSRKLIPDRECFIAGYKWITKHLEQLLRHGWKRPELFRRNKSKGIAWLSLWADPEVTPTIGENGQIIFIIKKDKEQ